jgi:tetratricopeptide (TPR) repeat protein
MTRLMATTRVALVAGFCLLVTTARAENDGQADLDTALVAKLSAHNISDLGEVIRLAQASLDAGLNKDDKSTAQTLLAATLTERAAIVSRMIFEPAKPDQRWPQYRRFALSDLERALKFDDKQPRAQYLVGRLNALPGGDRPRGIKALDKAIELDPDNEAVLADALVERGNLSKDTEKRLADYNRAIKLDGKHVKALRSRGLFYVTQKKFDEALADLNMVVELKPDDASSHEARGAVLFMQKKMEEAEKSFDKAIKLAPKGHLAYVHRARCRALRGETKTAIDDLDEAISLNGGALDALLLRARLYLQTDETKLAMLDVEQTLTLRPNLPEALLMRASIRSADGQFSGAAADLEKVRKLLPKNAEVLLQLAMLYSAAKRQSQAIEVFNKVIGLEADNWLAYRGRGDAYLNSGRQGKAIADYEKALKQMPEHSGLLNNLAWVLATSPDEKLRNGKKSVELATTACKITKYKEGHILSTLAAAYAETGNFDEAVKWSNKAVEVGGEENRKQLQQELKSYQAKKPWRELMDEEPAPAQQSKSPPTTKSEPPASLSVDKDRPQQ